ncbi:hypothetical protein LC724_21545 [Blautia sp. RD014234]|nr:hypothetical protein [Blautia parvula]
MTNETPSSSQNPQNLFRERIKRVDDAIALQEGDRVPFAPFNSALPYFLYGGTFRDSMYDYEKASQCILRFYQDFQPDADIHLAFTSGRSNELAGSTMIDWPGRPGTRVPDFSTHQVIEHEYMSQDEYPEFINDFMGFTLRKYIPRAFPNLKGLSGIHFVPSIVLSTTPLASFYSPDVQEAFSILAKIGEEDAKAAAASNALSARIAAMGIPPMMTGVGEAPFDIIGDYYRGTLGALTDQIECPDMIEKACDMLADIQIASYGYFKTASLPVKRVFFPLHKGMDGFMSPKQYEKLYWNPLKKSCSPS